ncbi:PadR family transcriptional regulator [Actinoplanes sp. NPDC049668]|uniref:PadR family transcriptional regulator n=1 Tax=unclassified Actinoplanes TaxID=2626549 RepID=UPI0033B8EAD3
MPRTPHASPQTLRLFEALLTDPTRHRYGYDLSRETGLASGTLYPILMRLAAQHLLDAGWEPSDEPGRPPRHTYRLTADGIALARERLAAAAGKARPATFTPREA